MNWHFDFHLQWLFLGECLLFVWRSPYVSWWRIGCSLDWMTSPDLPRFGDIMLGHILNLLHEILGKLILSDFCFSSRGRNLNLLTFRYTRCGCNAVRSFHLVSLNPNDPSTRLYNDNTLIFILRCQIEDTWCHSFESSFNLSVNRQA